MALAVMLVGVSACTRQPASDSVRTFEVRGVVRQMDHAERRMTIEHEAVADYMGAMTMPFRLGDSVQLSSWEPGDRIRFNLRVTDKDSWIEDLVLLERGVPAPSPAERLPVEPSSASVEVSPHPLRTYPFTNELGQTMTLDSLRGRALAITFVFTRCPLPNYCPRLTKNFAEASAQLAAEAAEGGPTNYHFISVTIDPEHDTPEVLLRYARQNGYDPGHWSFWTGSPERLEAFMTQSGVSTGPDGNIYNHSLRTLVVGPDGRLVVNFPMGGDLSEAIVKAMKQAMGQGGAARQARRLP